MKLTNLQTGQPEEVPDEQAEAAFRAGSHGFDSPDTPVPMRGPDGTVGTVLAKDAQRAIEAGGSLVSHQEYRKAELEEKHGGVLGTLAAGGEGVARGLSVGLSDPLAIKAAELIGGQPAAEATRTHLAEEREVHPYASMGGEALGTVAPMLATGGVAGVAEGAVEGARALTAAERMGTLLRAVGAPVRTVGRIGEGAASVSERALELVMGTPGASSAVGRIARSAVTSAVQGGAEGALFGAGQEISEDSLGDHELTAEKLRAALGHGALYGAMLGGGLGAGGTVARETFGAVVNRVAPSLERQAGVQMWKALSPLKKFSKEAEARAGGAAEVGKTLLNELDLPTNPLRAAISPEELGEKIDQAVGRKWGQMRGLMASVGGDVEASRVLSGVEDVIEPLRKKAGFEPVVKSLETYRDSLEQKLGLRAEVAAPEAMPAAQQVRRSGAEMQDYLRANPEAQEFLRTRGFLPPEAQFKAVGGAPPVSQEAVAKELGRVGGEGYELRHIPIADIKKNVEAWSDTKLAEATLRLSNGEAMPPVRLARTDEGAWFVDDGIHRINAAKAAGYTHVPAIVEKESAAAGATIPVVDLMDQRKALDELVYRETKALDPNLRVEALREIRGKLADLEIKAFDSAGKAAGKEGVGAELKQLRQDYQRLRIAQDASADTQSRMVTNRNLSLIDNMWGMAHAAGALAAGHPLGALMGVGTAVAHKMIRERGNAVAAVALSRIAKLDLLARATQKVDRELEASIGAYVRGETAEAPRIRASQYASPPTSDVQERFAKVEQDIAPKTPPLGVDHADKALPGLSTHAPKTAQALASGVRDAQTYLAKQRPQPLSPPDILGRPPRYSDQAASAHLRVQGAVDDPVGTITRGLATGKLHQDEIAAIQATSPKLFAQVQDIARKEISKHGHKMPYERKLTLSRILGIPIDPTLGTPMRQAFQATFAVMATQPHGSTAAPPARGAPKRQLHGFSQDMTLSVGHIPG